MIYDDTVWRMLHRGEAFDSRDMFILPFVIPPGYELLMPLLWWNGVLEFLGSLQAWLRRLAFGKRNDSSHPRIIMGVYRDRTGEGRPDIPIWFS